MLEETKADKLWVQSEFERVGLSFFFAFFGFSFYLSFVFFQKADKKDLDTKVNRKLFDDTCHDLSNSVNNCIQKSATLVRIGLFCCFLFVLG